MMMPSIVSSERSLLARSASSATRTVSPNNMTLAGVRARLLAHAGQPTAGHVLEALAELLLRLHERRARQHEDRVVLRQTTRDFDVVLVGEARADRNGNRGAAAEHEDDVARATAARVVAPASPYSSPSPRDLAPDLRQQRL